MKITSFLLLVCCLHVTAKTRSQLITFSGKDVPLETIFTTIKKQSDFLIVYNKEMLKHSKPVSVNVKDIPLADFLQLTLGHQGISFLIENKTIVLKVKAASAGRLSAPQLESPPIKISGTIIGLNNQPLAGATIRIKGKNISALSDANGYFELIADAGSVLLVSYIGFRQREFGITSSEPVNIDMVLAERSLDTTEVISTGYQEISRQRSTGSVTKINGELFNRRVKSSVLDRITDLVPGMLMKTRGDGTPLDNLIIRGDITINANMKPLLVVDNYIFDGDPNIINPNDVESISVLKDAAASAIWGVRAGNGVIVVTLKKGKTNKKMSISLNSNSTIGEKPDFMLMPILPSADIVELEKKRYEQGFFTDLIEYGYSERIPLSVQILERLKRGIITQEQADQQLQNLSVQDNRQDIRNLLTRNSVIQRHSLNIGGGDDKFGYYTSIGYDHENQTDINNKNDRLSIRYNNTWRPVKKLTLTGELNWTRVNTNKNNLIGTNYFFPTSPYQRLIDNNGNPLPIDQYNTFYLETLDFPGKLDWSYVPLNEAKNGNVKSSNDNIILVAGAELIVFPGLKISGQYQWLKSQVNSTDIRSLDVFSVRDNINRFTTTDPNTGVVIYPRPVGGTFTQNSIVSTSWNVRSRIDYNKSFNKADLTVLLGADTRESNSDNFAPPTQYGYNPETNTFQSVIHGSWFNKISGRRNLLSNPIGSKSGNIQRFTSYFGNTSLTYDRKYTVNLSGRIDQSNFFGVKANDRIVPLWSAGGAWVISNERFFYSNAVSNLRLRLTYGYSGNVTPGISPFATAAYQSGIFPTYLPSAILRTAPNPQIRWEKVKQINAGVDFEIKSIITGSIDIYEKKGIDLIGTITTSPSTGFITYTGNTASMQSKGIDITLSNVSGIGGILFSNTIIFGYNTNKIIKYEIDIPKGFVPAGNFIGRQIPLIGQPIDKLYAYKWEGLDKTNGSSQTRIDGKVVNSSEMQNARFEDYVYIGRSTPAIFGAYRPTIEWNNISLSANIIYRFKYYFQRSSFRGIVESGSSYVHKDYQQRWLKPGDETTTNIPAFFENFYSDFRYEVYNNSEILFEKGDMIKLQDVRLAYTTTKSKHKWLPFSMVSMYFYADNIGIIWKKSKYNPEYGSDLFGLPPARTYSLGITINY